ncbi:putative bifunctional diguanylate cyclase/phosphodiesterase [Actinoplanes couchii]|uniref:Diguanylate cyclase n=1 Tax=Actinoplanes couchii TaxID=403638 RepID=A0ABQ3XJ13_9ACTN|nr:EAL domain-containing protein [Actinoplanes couchii]MDR6324511.1 diguanylate cyclase (GGDEF)-like protein/PAS domain S-box-containing protein [Actinoplanes couchii]GID58489.1 hypothetical protein Aco03nite_068930 [Actinoplanes couchii]
MLPWTKDLPRWLPTGGGLIDEDWSVRHRLLYRLLAASIGALSIYGALSGQFATANVATWLLPLVLLCIVAAATLPGRRLPSVLVSLGFTLACAAFVAMAHNQTEAHFSFFIAVGALALYRDWAPFGVFLMATTIQHAIFGTSHFGPMYGHGSSGIHPLVWAFVHGGAVLFAATFQIVQWRLAEAEEERAQANLDESRAQLTVAFEKTPVPMAMLSPDGRVLRTNTAYRTWLRLPDELPLDFRIRDLPIEAVDAAEPCMLDQLVAQNSTSTQMRQYRRTDTDEIMWVEVHGTKLHDCKGRLRLIFVHCLDVTESRRHQEELQEQLRRDGLTGLLSRAAFEHDLVGLTAGEEPISILYLDIDRFKSINDGSGHAVGDELLRAFATRLASTVPADTLVTRLGGDEFVVALAGPVTTGVQVGQALLASCAQPLELDGRTLQVSVSAGLAVVQDLSRADQTVLDADTAMYVAKRAGGNRLQIFSDDMRVAVRERLTAETRLRDALSGELNETLPVWFQPIVAADTGRIIGAEALVRLRTPQDDLLSPFHFIPAAEETGMIVALGEHVLREAVRRLDLWNDHFEYISVNVSPRQLAEPDFVPMLANVLSSHPSLDASRLVIEITETALLSTSIDVRERLLTIKSLGVRIALDDFGTGYSSLTWLQSVPADVVKLDRSFVAGLSADPRKTSIIQAVLWLARSLGMTAIAEGVEDQADWDALRELGCPSCQGYLFGKPTPPAEFATALHASLQAAR